jgi:mycoredoxin-dependent peroxiredoxin
MKNDLAEADAQVLGISVDTPFAAAAFADKLGVEFPLLGDWPHNNTCRAYGTYDEERFRSARRTFVVDHSGVIRDIINESDAAKHPEEALRRVRELP